MVVNEQRAEGARHAPLPLPLRAESECVKDYVHQRHFAWEAPRRAVRAAMFGKKSESKKGKTSRPKQAEQLFKACESGRTNDVHKLLQISGTSYHINVFNDNGLTPLHLAAESATSATDANMFNYLSICKMLLDAGADPNIGTAASTHCSHFFTLCLLPL